MDVIDTEAAEKRRVIVRRHYWRHREEINAQRAGKQGGYYRQWYQANGRNRASDYSAKTTEYGRQHRLEGRASERIQRYIRAGNIKRPEHCSLCGDKRLIVAHHPDYDLPLGIIWCCYSCHKLIHLGKLAVCDR